jgi:hypothetical protein
MANRARPWAVQEVAVRAAEAAEKEKQKEAERAEQRAQRAKERAEKISAERERARVHQYIRSNVSFLPLDAYLKTNPVFHRDIADGVYATITLTGSNSGPVSALENLARDAMRHNCSFVNVNNTVVVPYGINKESLYQGVPAQIVFVPPEITHFATGFYRKKPKSKKS